MSDQPAPITVAIVGVGKIATDQHIPVLRANPDFAFVAAASPASTAAGVRNYPSLDELLAHEPYVQAVALCTPVDGRYDQAVAALAAGKDILMEKPPGATVAEVQDLADRANQAGRVLFTTWHSRFAPAVQAAKAWLLGRKVARMRIDWRENVRQWHPNQDWVWEPGALGVFDPGVNALSVVTEILPLGFHVTKADLLFPQGRQTPIHADLVFTDANHADMSATLDWLHPGDPQWEVRVETDRGALTLTEGGARMQVDGEAPVTPPDDPHAEYAGVYRRFAKLVRTRTSEVDYRPLQHAADAFLKGRRTETDPFTW